MLLLPKLRRTSTGRIPVSNCGAAQIAAQLLLDRPPPADSLINTLVDEPGLTLWCTCQAADSSGAGSNIAVLANWLAGRLDEMAAGCQHVALSTADDAHQESAKAWAERSVTNVGLARTACKLIGGSAATSPEYLVGLLHGADVWLDAIHNGGSGVGERLPAWLSDVMRQIRGRKPTSDTAKTVRAAQEQLEKRPLSSRRGNTLRRRWKPCGSKTLAGAVPRLGQLTARLSQLESDFDRTLQQEKLDSLRQLAYGASHEINNPLANISTRAQTLLRDELDPDRRRKLATINTQAFRAHEMISDMMLFAKPPALVVKPIDVAEVITQVLAELAPEAESRDIVVQFRGNRLPRQCAADGEHLAVALKALVRNSLEAIDTGGKVDVTLQDVKNGSSGEWLEITVFDDGPGISDDACRHLFDPFYSGREAGRGLGLGLSKCWRIVTLHSGSIETERPPGGGTRFSIRLPTKHPPWTNRRTVG